jgi:myo-inositol-1-phosphate synthase
MTWRTKEGVKTANYFGSITQASTVQIGTNSSGSAVHVPLKNLMPMVDPNDLVIGGWDISKVFYTISSIVICPLFFFFFFFSYIF